MNVKQELRDLYDDLYTLLTRHECSVMEAALREIEQLEHEIRQQRKQVRNLSNSPWDDDATRAMK